MYDRFQRALSAEIAASLPRGRMDVTICCPECRGEHHKNLLLRRVRRHIEELRSPVRVTIHTRCPQCDTRLISRVRIAMNSHRSDSVTTEVH